MPSTPPSDAITSISWSDYEAVLFDLDGVLTPTADIHEQAWRETFETVLPQVAVGDQKEYRDDDYAEHIDGRPRYEGVAQLLEAHDVALPEGSSDEDPGPESVSSIGNMKNSRFLEILERDSIRPFEGALALIERLEAEGVAVAVVSSSKNARRVLEAAGLLPAFGVIVDGVTVEEQGLEGKPAPDPFLFAAERLGAAPRDCVIVEDALSGVRAGKAGAFGLVVGVARDGEEDDLLAAGADIVVEDLSELV